MNLFKRKEKLKWTKVVDLREGHSIKYLFRSKDYAHDREFIIDNDSLAKLTKLLKKL